MKLLFDHNLAPKLVAQLADLYPGSIHVRDVRLAEAGDEEIWRYAREQALVIISKDSDFRQRSFLQGPPPKIVWVRLGNCTTADVERVLRDAHEELLRFEQATEEAFLIVGQPL